MNKINIDKDFLNIIDYLDDNGFKPFASCDGVLANHENPNIVNLAYISFLESDRILKLMCAFLRDSTFSVCINNHSTKEPYYYLGNLISGNRYSVYFENKHGNITQYFEKIIKGVNENKISISDDELTFLSNINQTLTNTNNSGLHFSIFLNTNINLI